MWTTNNICCFNLYFQGYWIHLVSIPPLYLSAQQPVCLTLFPILFNVSSVPRVSWLHYTLDLMTESDNHSQIWSTLVLRTLLLLMMVAPSCLGFNDIFGSSHWLRQTSVSTLLLKCCHHDIWKLQKILFRVKHIWCHLGGAHQYQPVLVLQKYFRIQKRNYLHQRRGGQRPGWGAGRVRVCMVQML